MAPSAALALPTALLLCAALASGTGTRTASSKHAVPGAEDSLATSQVYSTALALPASSAAVAGRVLGDSNNTAASATSAPDTSGVGDGPRRRPREQWDMVGPALLLGGTLALLVLAAVGHLASKALLASMLSAALSAMQLSRQPGPPRQG